MLRSRSALPAAANDEARTLQVPGSHKSNLAHPCLVEGTPESAAVRADGSGELAAEAIEVQLKAGDAIIIPAGTGHWFTKIDDHITYLMIRVDPDKVVPWKDEAASKAYLAAQ